MSAPSKEEISAELKRSLPALRELVREEKERRDKREKREQVAEILKWLKDQPQSEQLMAGPSEVKLVHVKEGSPGVEVVHVKEGNPALLKPAVVNLADLSDAYSESSESDSYPTEDPEWPRNDDEPLPMKKKEARRMRLQEDLFSVTQLWPFKVCGHIGASGLCLSTCQLLRT